MKKSVNLKAFGLLVAMPMLCLGISSCEGTDDPNLTKPEPKPEQSQKTAVEYEATIDNCDTKTALQGRSVIWSAGDEVAIFPGKDNAKIYRVKNGCEGQKTTTLVAVNEDEATGNTLKSNVAFYPAGYVTKVKAEGQGFSIQAEIPDRQTYTAGTFANGAMPMVAVTSNTDDRKLSFKNLFGVMKILVDIPGITVKSVEIKGNNGEKIAGQTSISYIYGGYPVAYGGTKDTMTLDCGNGLTQTGSQKLEMYVTLYPCTFNNGVTVKLTTTGKDIVRKISESVTIPRSSVLNMPAITEVPDFDGNGTEDLDEYDYLYTWTY